MTTNKSFKPDFGALVDVVKEEMAKIVKGDTSAIETMLLAQSYSMQAIFHHTMQKAFSAEYLSQYQAYSKIALKAQNQCRQTLATPGRGKEPEPHHLYQKHSYQPAS